jgi:hypothetical protein
LLLLLLLLLLLFDQLLVWFFWWLLFGSDTFRREGEVWHDAYPGVYQRRRSSGPRGAFGQFSELAGIESAASAERKHAFARLLLGVEVGETGSDLADFAYCMM